MYCNKNVSYVTVSYMQNILQFWTWSYNLNKELYSRYFHFVIVIISNLLSIHIFICIRFMQMQGKIFPMINSIQSKFKCTITKLVLVLVLLIYYHYLK